MRRAQMILGLFALTVAVPAAANIEVVGLQFARNFLPQGGPPGTGSQVFAQLALGSNFAPCLPSAILCWPQTAAFPVRARSGAIPCLPPQTAAACSTPSNTRRMPGRWHRHCQADHCPRSIRKSIRWCRWAVASCRPAMPTGLASASPSSIMIAAVTLLMAAGSLPTRKKC